MSAIVSTQVTGLGTVLVHGEYTASEVKNDYAALVKPIIDAFNRGRMVVNSKDPNGPLLPADPNLLGSLSAADVAAVKTSLENLLLLAQNGKVVAGKTYYLTIEMANGVDQLKKSLDAVGFSPALSDTDNLAALRRLQDLASIGVDKLILGAGDAVFSNKSLQSLIELEYVKTGNEVIGGNLESLKTALEATKAVIDALNAVQDLKNKIVPGSINTSASDEFINKQKIASPPDGTPDTSFTSIDDFSRRWNQIADQTFGYLAPTIDPTITRNPSSAVDKWKVNDATVTLFFSLREKISIALAKLSEINNGEPFAEGSVGANLQKVLDDMSANLFVTEGNPIYVAFGGKSTPDAFVYDPPPGEYISVDINMVRDKFGNALTDEFIQRGFLVSDAGGSNSGYYSVRKEIPVDMNRAIALWITDKQEIGNETESGNIQRTLTQAITASQNLNDTQKEDMRRFMFVFEEFYKSASSMLQTITRMIERMAQGIKQ